VQDLLSSLTNVRAGRRPRISFRHVTCLYLQPHDEGDGEAWDRVQRAGTVELARLGFFSHGTAAALSIGGQTCAHCLEEIDSGDLCIQYHCGHGFHDKCAAEWMQFEGEEEGGIVGDWQWLERLPRKSCPCCRAKVMNEKRSISPRSTHPRQ
jgi:hypothetical protein